MEFYKSWMLNGESLVWCYYVFDQESHDRMQYLLDVYIFVPEDIELNKQVLTWPQTINPVFDQNDEVWSNFALSTFLYSVERM